MISKFDVDCSYDHSYGYSHRFVDIGRYWYSRLCDVDDGGRGQRAMRCSVAFDTGAVYLLTAG